MPRPVPTLLIAITLAVTLSLANAATAQQSAAPSKAPVDAGPSRASDGESELDNARRRFARGVELAQRGDYAAAAKRFREALELRPSAAVRFNLASALFELGEYVESFNQLIVVLVEPGLAPEVRQRAEVLVEGLGEHVGTLNVSVGGDSQLNVSVDGEPLPPERLGSRFAVVPGAHEVVATRQGEVVSRRDLRVEAGARVLVDMRVVQGPAPTLAVQSPSAPVAPAAERPTEAPRRFGARDWRLWVLVGGAVVAIAAAGLAVGLTRDDGQAAVPGNFEPAVLSWK